MRTSIVAQKAVSFNAKIVQGNGWAEGLELSSGRNPLYVAGRRGRVARSGVSADYRKRFRSVGVLVDWLKANRKRDHKGKSRKSAVYRCGRLLQARLDYRRKKREENRKRAARRSKTMVRRKAKELWAKSEGNLYMLTLTYRPEDYPQDCDSMRHDMRNFIRRVNWKIDRKCDYIAVPERGKKGGRWHWHVVIDVHLDWREWEKLWRKGHIWVRKVRNLKHAVRYVCKYVAKTFEEGGVPVGQHRYLCSKGLNGWSVEYVAVEEELATWFYFRDGNEGYELVGVFSCKEKGFVWWEAVSESMGGRSLDIKDEFVRNSCGGDSMVLK